MNEIKIKVKFKKGLCYSQGIKLVQNDYNSTKLVFEFDDEEGTKIFELRDSDDNVILVDEIVNNELILARFDEHDNAYPIFTKEGEYVYEISLYKDNSKLTSASDKFKVNAEQVIIDGEIVETYTPMFDNLLSDLAGALQEIDNIDIDVNKVGNTATVSITKKDGTEKSVEIYDGLKGDKGDKGDTGATGPKGDKGDNGADAKINGVNTLTIEAGTNITLDQEGNTLTINSTGGGGGTSDYTNLTNKPKINNVELNGNKTSSDLGLQPAGNYALESEIPDVSHFITKNVNNLTYYTLSSELSNVATSGSYNDLSNKPTIPSEVTETTVSNWGFTKNIGTITGITMNGVSKGTSGVVDLGTVITSHQDISGKANKISVVQTSTSTIEINSNTFYKFGEVASLNITLASITDNTIYNEYMFEFVSGSTATTLTLPSSIKWLETPTIDANKIYQCSIVDNIGLLVGVTNV